MLLCNVGHSFDYETEKVIRIFFPFEKITVIHELKAGDNTALCEIVKDGAGTAARVTLNLFGKVEKERETVTAASEKELELALARCLYRCLTEITGYKSDWGIIINSPFK